MNTVMHRERLMLHGKPHEIDSIKSLIRHHEHRLQADTSFVYYIHLIPNPILMPPSIHMVAGGFLRLFKNCRNVQQKIKQ